MEGGEGILLLADQLGEVGGGQDPRPLDGSHGGDWRRGGISTLNLANSLINIIEE